jgi:coenzyme F420-reducing hydrogenase alpha subunit
MARTKTKTLRTDYLARVEGEGAMLVKIRDGKAVDVKLRIYEPPRFFEALLRGRHFTEAPDITARICGICPVAYQTSSVNAMEDACGVEVGPQIRALRRLLYCGEWIESHSLHVFMLHAPDFLGYASAIDLAKDHRELVERALQMKKTGNEVMRVIGGREVHPINVRVGGFYRAPAKKELATLVDDLERAREFALETVRFTAGLHFPAFEQDYELVALSEPDAYAIEDGRLVSNRGLDIPVSEYEQHFVEEQVEWSNALHSQTVAGGNYLVGPLARWALSGDRLTPLALEAAAEAGLGRDERNPFRTILIRSVELVFAADEALRLIAAYEPPERPFVEVVPRAGVGYGCSEAPRGICWHRYEIDDDGTILDAKIVPPTSQNQKTIESDLRGVVERYVDLPDDELALRCEQSIRNYDPCISCATHFLKLEVDRG